MPFLICDMSRKKKLFLNTFAGILKQLVVVICGFILPRYMLMYYGSSVNGLVASIANFLSFISLLDMGVGAVVQSNLYKPLANKDKNQISRIVKSSERFFRRLAYIFIVYIVGLCIVYPYIVNYGHLFTISLVIIISASTLAQYLFGMTYQLLLYADQKAYIILFIQIFTTVLNTIFSIILMKMGFSVHAVKLFTAFVFVMRPVAQMLYVHKHYDIDRKIEVVGEPIEQKWNGFSQHLAAVICQNIDITTLTLFSTLENVSIYSVYYNVINGIQQIILTASTGLEALWGNIIAKNENEKLIKSFSAVEFVTHTIVTILFTVTAIMIIPFVSIYTKGIHDTDYIHPVFGCFLVIAYGARCLRIPYFCLIKAAGHFKQTQNGAFISAILNIVITISLVIKFGLVGVAIGTLVAMLYHTIFFVWYLKDNIINRSIEPFLYYLFVDCIIAVLSYFATKGIVSNCSSYFLWAVLALKKALVVILVSIMCNLLLSRKQIKNIVLLLKKKEK